MSEETKIINAPERIWLQVGDDFEPGEVDFNSLSEVTWCQDNINGTDIEYVRADDVPVIPEPGTTEYGSWINKAMKEADLCFSMHSNKFKWVCCFEQALRKIAAAPTETK